MLNWTKKCTKNLKYITSGFWVSSRWKTEFVRFTLNFTTAKIRRTCYQQENSKNTTTYSYLSPCVNHTYVGNFLPKKPDRYLHFIFRCIDEFWLEISIYIVYLYTWTEISLVQLSMFSMTFPNPATNTENALESSADQFRECLQEVDDIVSTLKTSFPNFFNIFQRGYHDWEVSWDSEAVGWSSRYAGHF